VGHWLFLHLSLVSRSPYFKKCSTICWNWHFFVLDSNTRCLSHVTPRCSLSCPTFWEPSGSILPLVVGFFGGSLTWTRVCFPSIRCSFGYHASTSLPMCKGKCLVISLSYHTSISFIIGPLSYNITYPSWLATSYSGPPFMVLVWSYHWWSRYSFVSMSQWEWTYSKRTTHFRILLQLLLWRVEHMFRRRSPSLSFITLDNEWIFLLPEMASILWWTLSLLTWFT
jgi:hypothetical protein